MREASWDRSRCFSPKSVIGYLRDDIHQQVADNFRYIFFFCWQVARSGKLQYISLVAKKWQWQTKLFLGEADSIVGMDQSSFYGGLEIWQSYCMGCADAASLRCAGVGAVLWECSPQDPVAVTMLIDEKKAFAKVQLKAVWNLGVYFEFPVLFIRMHCRYFCTPEKNQFWRRCSTADADVHCNTTWRFRVTVALMRLVLQDATRAVIDVSEDFFTDRPKSWRSSKISKKWKTMSLRCRWRRKMKFPITKEKQNVKTVTRSQKSVAAKKKENRKVGVGDIRANEHIWQFTKTYMRCGRRMQSWQVSYLHGRDAATPWFLYPLTDTTSDRKWRM